MKAVALWIPDEPVAVYTPVNATSLPSPHDAKISKSEYKYFYNYDFETGDQYDKDDERYVDVDYYNYELNRKVPFIIWTKDSKGSTLLNKNIDKVMGMYDAMPTLANMFNFEYEYALGHDIFSKHDNIVVFPNGNWVTDKMYYNAQKEEYLLLKDSVVNKDEIENNKQYANKCFHYCQCTQTDLRASCFFSL